MIKGQTIRTRFRSFCPNCWSLQSSGMVYLRDFMINITHILLNKRYLMNNDEVMVKIHHTLIFLWTTKYLHEHVTESEAKWMHVYVNGIVQTLNTVTFYVTFQINRGVCPIKHPQTSKDCCSNINVTRGQCWWYMKVFDQKNRALQASPCLYMPNMDPVPCTDAKFLVYLQSVYIQSNRLTDLKQCPNLLTQSIKRMQINQSATDVKCSLAFRFLCITL